MERGPLARMGVRVGAKGWHHRGYLPHYDGSDVIQHVVFRLQDAVPAGMREGDDVLDQGLGSALLKEEVPAHIVCNALLHYDRERYALHAWCVMPNHVHALVGTDERYELGSIVRSWKSFTALKINAISGSAGAVWARDYFDRFMRDEAHYLATKAYIERNPVAAGLVSCAELWPFGSAGWTSQP